jgi:hypothetical protein
MPRKPIITIPISLYRDEDSDDAAEGGAELFLVIYPASAIPTSAFGCGIQLVYEALKAEEVRC